MKKILKVLDVGSDRDFIKKIITNCKNNIVEYSVIDPIPTFLESFKKENKNIKNLKLNFYKYCVSGFNKKINFYLNSDLTTSSYYKSNYQLIDLIRDDKIFNNKKIIKMKTLKLNTIFKKHSIKNLDLMTLCTQGSELDIIKGSSKYLKNISMIRVHKDWLSKYINEPLIGDIIEYLNKFDFQILEIKPANKWYGKSITSEILFINKKIINAPKNPNKKLLFKTISLLVSLGKITDVLIISRVNNLPKSIIKKELSEFSSFYKLIFKIYPFSKLILYLSSSTFYLLNFLGLKIEPPKFHALFKYLKVN